MMKLIKGSILNKIQVAAEVNGALLEHNLVVVTKTKQGDANPVYAVYGGELHEFGDLDRDTREEVGKQ